MAELTQFILGTMHVDFLQMKTADNKYLKDLIEQEIGPSLELYNSRESALKSLLCNEVDESAANAKDMFGDDAFVRLGDLERAKNRNTKEAWNVPVPVIRYGAATKLTLELLKQMNSTQLAKFHNDKLLADKKNNIKMMFYRMCLKTPAAEVDDLTNEAATPKAFWNADGVDTPRSNGQITFANTHNHYLYPGTADSLGTAGAELDTLIATITEHEGATGQVMLFARAGSTTSRLITNESTYFKGVKEVSGILGLINPAYQQTGIVQALVNGAKTLGDGVKVVGVWKEAIVIETPDLPEYYIPAVMYVGPNSNGNALKWRNHPQFKGLYLLSESGQNPIIGTDAQYRRYLGLGVKNRGMGAVLYTHSNSAWAEPTFS